jgi:hypothetical protein
MKQIKNKTYHNFMRVARMIERKGYDWETAAQLAHNVFAQYEFNPSGWSVLQLVDMIIPASEYTAEYT